MVAYGRSRPKWFIFWKLPCSISWLSHFPIPTNQKGLFSRLVFVVLHHAITDHHLSIYNQAEFSNWKTLNCWYSFCDTFCKSHLKKGKSWISPFLWLLFWSKCKCGKQIRSLRVTVHNSALFIVVSCWCLWFAACKIRTPMTFPFSI